MIGIDRAGEGLVRRKVPSACCYSSGQDSENHLTGETEKLWLPGLVGLDSTVDSRAK